MADKNQILAELLSRLNTAGDSLAISNDEVEQWPSGLLYTLEQANWLTKNVQAKSIACDGCEYGCCMPVIFTEDKLRAFIVCDHPEQQDHMGRISVDLSRLNQWQMNTAQLATTVTNLLGLDSKPSYQKESAIYKLGMLKGEDGRRWVSLFVQPLRFEIAGHFVPLGDMLFFDGGELVIDADRVKSLMSSIPVNIGKTYTPNTNKQDARKMATQSMYQNWRDEYQALHLKHPNKTDTWYSNQISKMDIAKGKTPETIRKNMKT